MRDGTQTKNRIRQAALGLFVEKGITETTIRDIAAAAEVSEGALYRHFESKDHLAWELFSENFTHYAGELDRLQEEQPALQAKLAVMIRRFCAFFDEDPVLFSYLLLAQHAQLQKVTPEMANPVEVMRKVLAAGIERGEIPPGDPNVAAAMVMGVVLQVAVFKIYGRISQPLSGLADSLVAAAWRVLQP